jgi:hypothetical protein
VRRHGADGQPCEQQQPPHPHAALP